MGEGSHANFRRGKGAGADVTLPKWTPNYYKYPVFPRRPRTKELTDYQPRRGTRLPDFTINEIDRLLALAPPGAWTSEPERIVAGWLTRNGIPFTSQEQFGGGRAIPGGAVVDFVITLREPPIMLRVQSYWHLNPSVQFQDDVSAAQMLGQGLRVADIWEEEIRDIDQLDSRMWGIILGESLFPYQSPRAT